MTVEIPISNRIRKYGYLYWLRKFDEDMAKILKKAESLEVWFEDSNLGSKKIDYKYRRISIGWKITRNLPQDQTTFTIKRNNKDQLKISCK